MAKSQNQNQDLKISKSKSGSQNLKIRQGNYFRQNDFSGTFGTAFAVGFQIGPILNFHVMGRNSTH